MSGMRHGLPLLLLAAAACAPTPGSQAPKPLKPVNGPQGHVTVDSYGGLLNRSISAHFQIEQNAYALVAHLGGDGRIRVLFPATPDESGYVRGKRMYRTTSMPAYYDAIPSLFSYRLATFRGLGARHDSYDGRGHGYVFMITSRTPLRYRALYDYAGWAEWELENYDRSHDPRYAIRSFADMLAGGAKYTLKFASSMTSFGYSSYADRAWDCSFLSGLGLLGNGMWWSAWQASWLGFGSGATSYCGGDRFPQFALGRGPVFTAVNPQPTIPDGEAAPSLDRPGRRAFSPRSEGPTRTTLSRVSPNGGPAASPFGDRTTRSRTASPRHGERRGTTYIDARTGREVDQARSARAARPRAESPRSDSPGRASSPNRSSAGSGSSGSTSSGSSTRSGASSSSGTRSNSQPASSPRDSRGSSGGERRPDGR